jgi:hypothetical protein
MNGDGKLGADDVLLILHASLAAPDMNPVADNGRQVNIILDSANGFSGERIIVPVKVDNADLIAAGEISIIYDSSVLRAVEVSSDSGALLVSNVSEPGLVRLAFASIGGPNSETIASIEFKILADDIAPLIFEKADLYRPDALPYEVKKIDGKFESWGIKPERTALLQNFPNPFNPETWIPYQLRENGEVTIQIFSIQGELVREFDLGHRSAGSYVSRNRAVYWDGRNEDGEEVASGIYFYSLKTADSAAVRKLTVLH